MKNIALDEGKVALVDDEDYIFLNQYNWSIDDRGYPQSRVNGKTTRMHKLLLVSTPDRPVDHRNLNKLDNQHSNLRLGNRSQNAANRGKQINNKSGFKGVYWRTDKNKWQAGISIHGKTKYLGLFDDIRVAACAYDEAAIKAFGEFARINRS